MEESEDTRVIFIGNKPVMNYVLSIVTLMNKDVKRISIKARGKAINRAVDVAEVVRHKFVTKTQIEDILINTEELFREDGSSSNVSTIDIILRV
ncbi:DNA-binding protein Alba [Methanosphaera sp. BMS]|uniref:DNA-binding protein Alba n=1 Tax=Methanosphaera sp. BMS TaxID=1789762 RepID=UPI00214FABD4|nr:DNA-binding protein Alba [Methanosphaera sp. BMS]